MDFDLTEFGKRIRLSRMRLGLTQRRFCALAKIPEPTLSRIECGKLCPRIDRLAALALMLGVSADYILGLAHDNENGTPNRIS